MNCYYLRYESDDGEPSLVEFPSEMWIQPEGSNPQTRATWRRRIGRRLVLVARRWRQG
jgi:hypothetical protein